MKYSDVEFRRKYLTWKGEDGLWFGGGMGFGFLGILIFCIGVSCLSTNSRIFSGSPFMHFIVSFIVSGILFLISALLFSVKASLQKEFLTDVDATETQASRRNSYIYNNPVLEDYLPLVQQICRMNPEIRHYQEQIIEGWYQDSDFPWSVSIVFDAIYSGYDVYKSKKVLLGKELSVRKAFVTKLFQLAIAEDGIHLDEWNWLLKLMEDLNFNKVSFNFFKKRYSSLRTEFDEEEKKKFSEAAVPTATLMSYYYTVLGLTDGASDEEVKKAYHALALQHHPDLIKNADRIQECEAMMAKINEAYEKIKG